MQLKWEKRDQQINCSAKHSRLVALLVDGHQDSTDKPDHVIARLGSIEERFLKVNIGTMRNFHKGLFWTVVYKRLYELDMASEDRIAIENEIAEKIPRPCDEWALWGVTCIPRFDR